MRVAPAIALALLLNAGGAWAARAPADAAALAREARALEAEIGLAAKPSIYFVLDARASKLLVKAAGLTLKTLPITHLTQWGDAVATRPHSLVAKSTLMTPRRPTIRPAERKPEDAEASATPASALDVLEVTSMPARFHLTLTRGVSIAVRPEPEGFFSRVVAAADRLAWHLARPLPTLWRLARGRPYTALYVRLAAPDARALYWACAEGAELLVLSR
ncbi:MAG: hypothetical protein ACE147_10830 [Candidatus Methylomirabilales bacterium]